MAIDGIKPPTQGLAPTPGADPFAGMVADGGPKAQPTEAQGADFAGTLKELILDRPAKSHTEADQLATAFAAGGNIDPHKLAIASAKAGIEVQMATRTISQATTAIRTLMQMQI